MNPRPTGSGVGGPSAVVRASVCGVLPNALARRAARARIAGFWWLTKPFVSFRHLLRFPERRVCLPCATQ